MMRPYDQPSAEHGVEPFLVSSAVVLILAQRLVRKYARTARSRKNCLPGPDESGFHRRGGGLPGNVQGSGCDICNKTGYKGRVRSMRSCRSGRDQGTVLQERRSWTSKAGGRFGNENPSRERPSEDQRGHDSMRSARKYISGQLSIRFFANTTELTEYEVY